MKEYDMMIFYPTFLLGAVFLLFPLAHLRLLPAVPIYLAEIPLLMVLLGFLCSPVWKTSIREFLLRERNIVLATTFFFGGAFLALLVGGEPLQGLGLWKSFIFLPLLLMFLLAFLVRTEEIARQILFLWWLGIFATALAAGILFLEGAVTYDGRLASLYASPNYLAMLLAPGVLIGLFLSATSGGKQRFWYGLGTWLILLVLLGTRSYAPLGALMVSLLVPFFSFREKKFSFWKPAVLVVLLLVGIGFFREGTTEKFQSIFDFEGRSSSASRLMIWEAAWKISQDHFPWGIGPGRFQEQYLAYQKFFPPYLEWAVPEPHNLFLALFLSTGLLGLLGFLWVLLDIGRRLIRDLRHRGEPSGLLQGKLYASLILWFLLVGIVDTPYFKNDLTLAWWGLVGLTLAWLSFRKRPQLIS